LMRRLNPASTTIASFWTHSIKNLLSRTEVLFGSHVLMWLH